MTPLPERPPPMTAGPYPLAGTSATNGWSHYDYHEWVANMLESHPPPDGPNGMAGSAEHHREVERLLCAVFPDATPPAGGYFPEDGHAERHNWEIDMLMRMRR